MRDLEYLAISIPIVHTFSKSIGENRFRAKKKQGEWYDLTSPDNYRFKCKATRPKMQILVEYSTVSYCSRCVTS